MGRRPKRLIIQADLTNEEDQEFLAWVHQIRKRRRLADEIREGLRERFRSAQGGLPAPSEPQVVDIPQVRISAGPADVASGTSAATKLRSLVGRF